MKTFILLTSIVCFCAIYSDGKARLDEQRLHRVDTIPACKSDIISSKDPFYFALKRGQTYKISGCNKECILPVDLLSEEEDTIDKGFLIDPIIETK